MKEGNSKDMTNAAMLYRTLCRKIFAVFAVMLSGAVFATAADPLAGELKGGRSKGVLLLSFDDRNLADWEKAIALFGKYGAHATFFVTGKIEGDAVRILKKLRDHGHTIGLAYNLILVA